MVQIKENRLRVRYRANASQCGTAIMTHHLVLGLLSGEELIHSM
jgi:hypothetical protein